MTTDRLMLLAPNKARYGTREAKIGATVFLALDAILGAGGRLPVTELVLAVWGTERVLNRSAMRTIASLCHRANRKLAEVGHPTRCGTDAGDVVLC